ncbi:adenylate/guanylate cyclase domain-containing protein [Alteromonas gracilis]|uniref:adenylate/guanylate cyclase domain-containing protein n=1 Tax=Alteromonas gracilis TaxID=1479524 RepID=UPI0030D01101
MVKEYCNTTLRDALSNNNEGLRQRVLSSTITRPRKPLQHSDYRRELLPYCAVIFADLSGFQTLSRLYGDYCAFVTMTQLTAYFEKSAHECGARIIKTNGDQHIAICHQPKTNTCGLAAPDYANVQNALFYADAIHCISNQHAILGPLQLGMRVGIAFGDVIVSNSLCTEKQIDIWGSTVNLAAMIEHYTQPFTTALDEQAFGVLSCAQPEAFMPCELDTKIGRFRVYCRLQKPITNSLIGCNVTHGDMQYQAFKQLTGKYSPYH